MCSFTFATFGCAFLLFPVIPLRIVQMGGSKAQAGLFLSVYTFACAMAAPLSGAIADTIGRRRVLIVGAVAFLGASIAYGLIESFHMLLLFACLHGVFWSGLLASSSAIITEIIPLERRAEGLAWWGMASNGAVAIAPAIGLIVFRRSGWTSLIGLMVAISIVMLVLALRVRGGTVTGPLVRPAVRSLVEWRVIAVATTLSCVAFGYGGLTSYVALLSIERGINPPSLFFTVFAVTILASRIFLARIADTKGPLWLMIPSLALVPISFVAVANATSAGALAFGAVLFGVGFGCMYPAFASWILRRTSDARRAATFGSMLWAFDTGIASGSLVLGKIAEHRGLGFAFMAAAGVSLLALPVFFLTSRLLPVNESGGVTIAGPGAAD